MRTMTELIGIEFQFQVISSSDFYVEIEDVF